MSCNRKAEVRSTRSGRLRLTMRGPPWVKWRKPRSERMFSGLPSIADLRQRRCRPQDLASLGKMRSESRQAAGSCFKLPNWRFESCGVNSPNMNGPPFRPLLPNRPLGVARVEMTSVYSMASFGSCARIRYPWQMRNQNLGGSRVRRYLVLCGWALDFSFSNLR